MIDDKKLIIKFIHDLFDWLEISFLHKQSDHKWPVIYVREELREDAKKAWVQFKKIFLRRL